jgi:hypothetical protein
MTPEEVALMAGAIVTPIAAALIYGILAAVAPRRPAAGRPI